MPIKTSSGKWKWGSVERDSKKELVQTVYGIWKKNGSKGSFSDFLKGTHESVISEGKHWPADYIKTAKNTVKASKVGDKKWFEDIYLNSYINDLVSAFEPLSHKNSNLGYFASIIRWFIEYSTDKGKNEEFLKTKLPGIIKTLLFVVNNPAKESKIKDQLKKEWTFADFEKYQKDTEEKIEKDDLEKQKNAKSSNNDYTIDPIESFDELARKYGDNDDEDDFKTGYHSIDGEIEFQGWCHTNGRYTYNSWTQHGKYMFFVIAKNGWENIDPPDPTKDENAYDEYGTSLIAILVNNEGELLKSTLRWNHAKEPSKTKPGMSVDEAFTGWGDLAYTIGKDFKGEVKKYLDHRDEERTKRLEKATSEIKTFINTALELDLSLLNDEQTEALQRLETITLPDGLEKIGMDFFRGCTKLTSIVIPDSVTSLGTHAFGSCTHLKSVAIGKGIAEIGAGAFEDCIALEKIDISSSVTKIGISAFRNCSSLKSLVIPDSVVKVLDSAFRDCSSLTEIHLGKGLRFFGESCFINSGIETLDIPGNVKKIGRWNFSYCKNLKHVNIQDGVEGIDFGAFYECEGLESISIPPSLKYIQEDVFNGCEELKRVDISDIDAWNKLDCKSGFSNPMIHYAQLYLNNEQISEVALEADKINQYAFLRNNTIKSVYIKDNTNEIKAYAFCQCKGLENLVFDKDGKDNLEIRPYAFKGCQSIKEVLFPPRLFQIYHDAFQDCTGLTAVTFLHKDGIKGENDLYDLIIHSGAFMNAPIKELTITGGTNIYIDYHAFDWDKIETFCCPKRIFDGIQKDMGGFPDNIKWKDVSAATVTESDQFLDSLMK